MLFQMLQLNTTSRIDISIASIQTAFRPTKHLHSMYERYIFEILSTEARQDQPSSISIVVLVMPRVVRQLGRTNPTQLQNVL